MIPLKFRPLPFSCAIYIVTAVVFLAEEPPTNKDIKAGDEARSKWNYAEAARCYTRALEKDPFNANVYAVRGFMYARLGELDRAISDTSRAVQLDPNNPMAYQGRGLAYAHRDQLDEAIADLSEAIRLAPDDWRTVSQRGDFYARKHDAEKAIADYDRAIELAPTVAVNFCCRGDLNATLGHYESAAADYLRAQKLDPQYSAPYISYAWMLATCYDDKVRNPAKAIEYAKIGLDLNPKREDAWPAFAAALASAGKFEEAAKWQQKFADSKVLSEQARVEAQSRVALYRSHQPLIQPMPVASKPQSESVAPTTTPEDDGDSTED